MKETFTTFILNKIAIPWLYWCYTEVTATEEEKVAYFTVAQYKYMEWATKTRDTDTLMFKFLVFLFEHHADYNNLDRDCFKEAEFTDTNSVD